MTISLKSKYHIIPFILLLGLTIHCTAKYSNQPERTEETLAALEHGRIYTQWFYENELEKLYAKFSQPMEDALSLNGLRSFRKDVEDQMGTETDMLDEFVGPLKNYRVYERIAQFDRYNGPVQIQWTLDASQLIYGFFVRPVPQESPSRYLDYQTKIQLHLPFRGAWYVYWGGRSVRDNYHAAYQDQRFAYDFLMIKNGSTHTGDGTKNEHYHCFDKPIIAPAAGTVVVAVDTIPDNIPGTMNPLQPLGNHVIIDHGDNEFSFLAHLEEGSVAVTRGDIVQAGQLIGRCGNSGNSSEPHVHYHLQNTEVFSKGEGLPAPFRSYLADGNAMNRGEPTRGQMVENK